ncbi:SMI1/KNR4 family protein [Paenibacillus sp. MER 180]|uniref:SMI1/KNR4 family protein n=1 Tax=Paenibacillus sp. MER 180 TaxID=2939570 RepID=UPI00203C983B|nr:SMI1/KNR4 family protein [Paenibacillus sp. MER 180]MCM3293275.1 SMI1/KNR4 family protein [Paenibacillus sp. MER 180]
MKIIEIIKKIEQDSNCRLVKRTTDFTNEFALPKDLNYFFSHYDSLQMFSDKPYGIKIVSSNEFIPTSKRLYPEDDVIWEELEGDISNEWYLIAESEQINQYISIDLSDSHLGYCYDSFLETHATLGDSQIIAKSFTELLEHLYASKGENWFWLADNFESYGDAYDGR